MHSSTFIGSKPGIEADTWFSLCGGLLHLLCSPFRHYKHLQPEAPSDESYLLLSQLVQTDDIRERIVSMLPS